ncbi:hypothetical protein [Pedobacter sp. MC2016-24]|uniref:hypothetical protein n=1 Tax=Pedobacter sp. MC2016-24 TaxID=2780090 RepID=UPI0018816322|nr:hypothetical protein [Pedobacter sp. MC2016-24]MBE9602070.1 hypothetical protein [Pedobacter sp. MC2016-24]
MKAKLTPLNLTSATCLVAAVLLLVKPEPQQPQHVNMTGFMVGFCILIAVVGFVSDLIFRKFIPDLKKLWIVEGMMILITIILMFILKVSLL